MKKEQTLLEACLKWQKTVSPTGCLSGLYGWDVNLLEAIDREVERQKEAEDIKWNPKPQPVASNHDLLAEQKETNRQIKETNRLLRELIEATKSWNFEPPKYKFVDVRENIDGSVGGPVLCNGTSQST